MSAVSPKWLTTGFTESAIPTDGATPVNLVLLDPGIITDAAGQELSRIYKVKRIVARFRAAVLPLNTTTSSEICTLNAACFTQDAEDTDETLNSTAPGSILVTERVVHVESHTFTVAEGTADAGRDIWNGYDFSFDIRTNINLRGDQLLLYAFQFSGTVAGAVNLAAVSGLARVLVVPP